jgi:hypothetical protein
LRSGWRAYSACSSASSAKSGSIELLDSPAHDYSSKDVDDEGHVHETLPSRDICEIADPQLIWSLGLELAVDAIERRWCLRIDNRRAHDLASHDVKQASLRIKRATVQRATSDPSRRS